MQHDGPLDRIRQLAAGRGHRDPAEAIIGRVLQVRLAKTKAHGSDTYPEYSNSSGVFLAYNAYPIVFVDSTFTEGQGAKALTTTDRQAAADKYVRNLASGPLAYIPEGTVITVFYYHQRWWTVYLRPGSRLCMAKVKEASGVAKGDSTFTVDNVVPMDGQIRPVANAASELEVTNWAKWAANDNADVMIAYDEDAAAWKFVQGACLADQ